jgi:dihydroflavonol-4-reductase
VRIGVTGAFGFLGASLVARLLDSMPRGATVVAFSSRTARNPLFDPARLTVAPLDVLDADGVQTATRGLDALFHFAGRVSYARHDRRATWDVNVRGARNVFEAVLANRIPRLVYVSSINVLGAVARGPAGGTSRLADETNDVYDPAVGNPNSFRSAGEALAAVDSSVRGDYGFLRGVRVAYFDSKLAGMELARRLHRERGLPVVSVLPGTAVGPGDIHYDISELIDRVFTNRLAATFPGGTSFVDSRDCAEGISLAWQKGRPGESYVISGADADNLSYRDFMRRAAAVAAGLGRRVRQDFLVMPPPAGIAVAALLEAVVPRSRLAASLGTALVRSGSMVHAFTSAKARRELGYVPRRALEQGIADCWRFLQDIRRAGG